MARALVIDDSRTQRKLLTEMLGQLSYEVDQAADGREALERLQSGASYEFALVDWNMPVMNGLDFVRAARSDQRFQSLPLIMVTTVNDIEPMQVALAAGASEYVMKPFDAEMISDKLRLLGVLACETSEF